MTSNRRNGYVPIELLPNVGTAVNNMLASFRAPSSVKQQAMPSTSSSNSGYESGSGSGSFTGGQSYAGTTNPGSVNNALRGLQGAALLGGDFRSAKSLGNVGTFANIATAQTPGQLVGAALPSIAKSLGIPGSALGLGAAVATKNVGLGVDTALGMFSLPLAAANMLSGAILGKTVGGLVNDFNGQVDLGRAVLGKDAGMFDSYDAAKAINESDDPLGAFISQLPSTSSSSTASSEGATGGYRGSDDASAAADPTDF